MAKKEAPLHALQQFIPEGTYETVARYLHEYHIHITVTRARSSILGDYRNAVQGKNHRISVNGNLNPYAFLYTLVHEIAHLLTYDRYGHRVASHGKEWKGQFSALLADFLRMHTFPDDIRQEIEKSLHNPAASSCAEDDLLRVLRKYDKGKEHLMFVENVPEGKDFQTPDGRVFRRGARVRKRYKCIELSTKREYLFSPVYEVKPML